MGLLAIDVSVDGDWITDPLSVKDVFKEHFASRFKQPDGGRTILGSDWGQIFVCCETFFDCGTFRVMESLHLFVSRAVNEGVFKGIQLHESLMISHLFYADDVMFLGEWSDTNLKSLTNILKCFFLASGLKINFHKSQMLGIGVPPETINQEYHQTSFSSSWCSILRETRWLSSKGFNFVARCKKRVGDGQNTKFWLDAWKSDIPFRLLFPRLFALEVDKEASVASKMGSSSVADSFRRQIRDGSERQQWSDLSVLLQPVILSSSIDRWFCDLNGDGVFRVRDVRISIDDLLLPSSGRPTRWVKFIPIKTNIFIWRARLDRIPTRCNLAIRGVALDSSLCPLCGLVPEDVAHVLFRCEVSQHILRKICRWWDLVWFDVLNFSEWDGWFDSVRLPFKLKLLLEGVFCAAWWHIWVFRNRSIFDVIPPRRSTLFDDIVAWCFSWCGSRCNISISWDCWLKTPYLITL
ncbi:RNA-directed DNA polymerase, eukaryota [Tanacetum coccineum]